jgi:iron complex transport system permease protein
MKRSLGIFLSVTLALTLLTLVVTPLIGPVSINPLEIMENPVARQIFWAIRLPRIVFAWLVGFSLALVGTLYQSVLRNELATPYTLGVSSGGALGAVLAIKTGAAISIAFFNTVVVFSMAGSLATILLVYMIARSRVGLSPLTLILAGVTVGMVFSSVNLFIHYLADFTETYLMIRWMMGGLQVTGWDFLISLLPFSALAFVWFFYHSPALNLMSSGEEVARSKGVDVRRMQKTAFIGGSVLIGMVVALAGPIGFVGLIVPHLVRLVVGPDHRYLIPAAAFFGGLFLIWCDTIARMIIAPAELPVGVITAILGGPFFIWLLIRQKRLTGFKDGE